MHFYQIRVLRSNVNKYLISLKINVKNRFDIPFPMFSN